MTDFIPSERRFTGRMAATIIVGFFCIIIAVNGLMLTLAVKSFGGLVVGNSYVASQSFNTDIAVARAQPIRQWTLDLSTDTHTVALHVTDRNGVSLHDLGIRMTISRPTHDRDTVILALDESIPGVYSGETMLEPGRWIATVTTSDGQTRSFPFEHAGAAS